MASAPAQARHRRRGGHSPHASAPVAFYKVRDENSLAEVAIRLYGKASYWPRIARWNHLHAPYAVWKDRKLKLRKKPTLTPQQGDRALLQYWRKHFDLEGRPERATPVASPAEVALVGRLKSAPEAGEDDLDDDQAKARKLLAEGEKSFAAKSYPEALERFHSSRELDPDSLPSWFYEIRTLKLLNREDDARASAQALLKRKPQLKDVPMFRKMFPARSSE